MGLDLQGRWEAGGRKQCPGSWVSDIQLQVFCILLCKPPLSPNLSKVCSKHQGVCAVISLYGNEGVPVDGAQGSRSSWSGRLGGQASAATWASQPLPFPIETPGSVHTAVLDA